MQLYEWSERSERTNCICCCFCIDERSEAVSWFYCQGRCSCMNEVNCYCFVFVLLFDSLYSYAELVLLPHRGGSLKRHVLYLWGHPIFSQIDFPSSNAFTWSMLVSSFAANEDRVNEVNEGGVLFLTVSS